MSETTPSNCSQCGAPVSVDAPFGTCSACLTNAMVEVGESELEAEPSQGSFGNYRLLGRLGEGGFGEVYEAEQRRPVRRRVALKLLKRGMDTRQVVARFEAERQALALMDHPNVAQVYDAGESDDGRPYVVMELVAGRSITDHCREQGLGLRERLALFVAVCQGVQHAHSKGIIHRDVKPSNVLVTVRDGEAVPKVIDFGVAKATEEVLTPKTIYTELGRFVGTPVYMSPEQAAGGANIDTRSDVYSLGVLLYELLTASTPFDADRLRQAGYAEMERILQEECPPKPSTRLETAGAGRRSTQGVRRDLDWIVMKALEKDPERRYATAVGLGKDVERYLRDEPVEAGPPSRLYQMGKFARRNRLLLTAVVGAFVALVAGTIVSSWQAIRATAAEAEASRQAERARGAEGEARNEAAVGKAVTKFLTEDVVISAISVAFDENGLSDPRKILQAVQEAELTLEELTDQPLVQAVSYAVLARMYERSIFPSLGLQPAARSLELYRAELGPLNDRTLEAGELYLRLLVETGKLDLAEAQLADTLARTEAALESSHPRVVALLAVQEDLLGRQGRHLERAEVLRRILRTRFSDPTVWRSLRDAHVAAGIEAFEEMRYEEAREQVVIASFIAATHNRGGYWHEKLILTIPVRKKFMQAGVAPQSWGDYLNVLRSVPLDELDAKLELPEPARSMTRAYLLNLFGDPVAAVRSLREQAELHPRTHVIQHGLAYYLECADAPDAVDQYFEAGVLAAARGDVPARQWYASNWDRLRQGRGDPVPVRRIPLSRVVHDPRSGHVYARLEFPLSWDAAHEACRLMGGQLATISDERENEFLYTRFASSHACWLGASPAPGGQGWQWADGAPWDYENWAAEFPRPDRASGAGLAFGTVPTFRIYGEVRNSIRFGRDWFHYPKHGLTASRDPDDPQRNALMFYALCEWESADAWQAFQSNR